jgi:hypothetical protein
MFDTRLDWREVINFNQGIRKGSARRACWEIEQNACGEGLEIKELRSPI